MDAQPLPSCSTLAAVQRKVVILDLPVAVPSSAAGNASATTGAKVAELFASHPSLLQSLLVEPEGEAKGFVTQQQDGPAAVLPSSSSSSQQQHQQEQGEPPSADNAATMTRKGAFGRLVAIVDNSKEAPLNLMGNPKQFSDKPLETVLSLPWGALQPDLDAAAAAAANLNRAGAGGASNNTLLPINVLGSKHSAAAANGRGGGNRGTEGLYMTQAATLLYSPSYCTNLVVEVVTRRRKEKGALHSIAASSGAPKNSSAEGNGAVIGDKRPREDQNAEEGGDTAASKGEEPTTKKQPRPQQQVIGYRLQSVVTRAATLATPAQFCFSLSAPEVGLRTAAFPPAAFFRTYHMTVHETPYRYEDDVALSSKNVSKPPPTIHASWPVSTNNNGKGGVPSAMSPAHVTAWGRATQAERMAITEALTASPCWGTVLLQEWLSNSGRCPRPHMVRNLVACTTYQFPHGPFGKTRLRLGADPSADPTCRYHQRLVIRLDGFSPIRLTMRELAGAAQCASVLQQIRAEASRQAIAVVDTEAMRAQHEKDKSGGVAFGPTIVKYINNNTGGNGTTAAVAVADGGGDASNTKAGDDASLLPIWRTPLTLFYCQLLEDRRGLWTVTIDQYLEDRSFVAIMNHRPLLRQCDDHSGWFQLEVLDRLHAYARDDFNRWLLDEVAPRIAEMKAGGASNSANMAATVASSLLSKNRNTSSNTLGAANGGGVGGGGSRLNTEALSALAGGDVRVDDDGALDDLDSIGDDDLDVLADGLSDLGSSFGGSDVGSVGGVSDNGIGSDDDELDEDEDAM